MDVVVPPTRSPYTHTHTHTHSKCIATCRLCTGDRDFMNIFVSLCVPPPPLFPHQVIDHSLSAFCSRNQKTMTAFAGHKHFYPHPPSVIPSSSFSFHGMYECIYFAKNQKLLLKWSWFPENARPQGSFLLLLLLSSPAQIRQNQNHLFCSSRKS